MWSMQRGVLLEVRGVVHAKGVLLHERGVAVEMRIVFCMLLLLACVVSGHSGVRRTMHAL